MGVCSFVNYVEPNYVSEYGSDVSTDGLAHESIPNLEDMCIGLNIEVEICGRNREVVQKSNGSKVLVMSWNDEDGHSSVSFMQGTKVYAYDEDRKSGIGEYVNSLTTNYTDVFYTDIVDYGASEMFGIKSVQVSYDKFMVPMVNVEFVDVRGLALLQPTELRNNKDYNGVKGFDKDNIASSFFQCFFVQPYPKFTIYLKGVYGKPIAYEMTCYDFRTNFNAAEGSFNVTAKFMGYMFSFMTDISLNALMAAPYSDYLGETYWKAKVDSGEFFLYGKDSNERRKMPTLVEMWEDMKTKEWTVSKEIEENPIVQEFQDHTQEIAVLNTIKEHLINFYTMMYDNFNNCHKNLPQIAATFLCDKLDDGSGKIVPPIVILTRYGSNSSIADDENLLKELGGDELYNAISEINQSISSYNENFPTGLELKPFKLTNVKCVTVFTENGLKVYDNFQSKGSKLTKEKVQAWVDYAKDNVRNFDIYVDQSDDKSSRISRKASSLWLCI